MSGEWDWSCCERSILGERSICVPYGSTNGGQGIMTNDTTLVLLKTGGHRRWRRRGLDWPRDLVLATAPVSRDQGPPSPDSEASH